MLFTNDGDDHNHNHSFFAQQATVQSDDLTLPNYYDDEHDDDDFNAVKTKEMLVDPVSDRLKKFFRLSIPLVLSFLMMNIQE